MERTCGLNESLSIWIVCLICTREIHWIRLWLPRHKYGENVAKVLQLAAWQKARKKELVEDM